MTLTSPELSIVVPTFNEKQNVVRLVDRITVALPDVSWEILFVDDDSPDGTAELVRGLGEHDVRIRCIQRLNRRGLASACIEGMLASSATFLGVMDADLQHDETLLQAMIQTLKDDEADLVLGSRYAPGGSIGRWSRSRTQLSKAATKVSLWILGRPLHDPMSGFFMLRRSTFMAVVRRLGDGGFKLLFDILASSPDLLRLKELPYVFREREFGNSKLDWRVGWEFGIALLTKCFRGHLSPRLLSFCIIGGFGVIVHFVTLTILFRGCELTFMKSQGFATLIAMTTNFYWNNLLTYRDVRLRGFRWLTGWLSFTLTCSVGAIANVGIASIFFDAGVGWVSAALAGVAIGAIWNYGVNSTYTWGLWQKS